MDRNELNTQTAKISWKELEVFFANGTVVYVSSKLDLIDVGRTRGPESLLVSIARR